MGYFEVPTGGVFSGAHPGSEIASFYHFSIFYAFLALFLAAEDFAKG